ncbi:MAG: hypothetical protein FWE40_07275 [Oscillospiraceae bacterium]|jgi:hypothetical protein|nr:hypothetical protein [Oscillospiraceae bacterium]
MKRIIALIAAVAMLALLAACGTTPPAIDESRMTQEAMNVIVAAGEFWEDWWNLRGAFAWEHITEGPNDPVFAELQPSSGFANFNDLRSHLLQYYTEAWLAANLHYHFVEEDGMLLIATARAGFARADWSTMELRQVVHDGQFATHAEVEVTYGSWHRDPSDQYPHEVLYRFTFVDGRIDTQERLP